jgi:DNA polymerase-1
MAEIKFELVKSTERLGHVANEILDSPCIGFDIETTGLKKDVPGSKPSPFRDDIRLMSVNTGKGVYVIDHYETKTLQPVVSALAESKGIKMASNAKYEQSWLLQQYGAEIWPLFDPFRASALLTNGKKLPNDLYSMYERYLKRAPPTRDLGASDWSLPLTPEHYEYSASDVTYLHDLRDVLKPMLAQQGLNRVALIEFGAILPEAAVELNGFPLDADAWRALAEENQAKATELHKKLIWKLPNPKSQMTLMGFEPDLNLNSPPQMLASLRKLGIRQQCEECRGRGRTRQGDTCSVCEGVGIVALQNTREMTIAMFAADFPIVKDLIEYRGYDKSVSTYGPEWLRWIDPTTGRIHSSFWPFTEAGRYSSGSPNVQNLPRDKRFRRCFKAPKGKRFRLGDYSNIEMRIIAELSQDPRLLQIFRNGEDAHYVTASTLVGKIIAEITTEERQQAKPVNFGFCIAEDQRVLTNHGLVPIQHVQDWHLVWDGVEWVTHDGVVDMGVREVVSFDGLTATPDHKVYTNDGSRLPFGEIASSLRSGRLAIGSVEGVPVRYSEFDRKNRTEDEESTVRRSSLLGLSENEMDLSRQFEAKIHDKLYMPGQVQGFESWNVGRTLRCDGAALRAGYPRVVPALQGSRNSGPICFKGGVYSLGPEDVSDREFQGESFRSERQQRALFARQPPVDDVFGKQSKQGVLARTYDLLNAGPRHRFTVENVIVSNCYGMMPPKMVLYAMANYGVALSLKQSTEFRRKFFELYARLPTWHQELLEAGERTHFTRNKAGRIRYLNEDAHNEYLNTPVQGLGAEGLKASLRAVYMRMKKFGAWNGPVKMINHIHDEIITEIDDNDELDREVDKELKAGMHEGMEQFLQTVPVVVETKSGSSWGAK